MEKLPRVMGGYSWMHLRINGAQLMRAWEDCRDLERVQDVPEEL